MKDLLQKLKDNGIPVETFDIPIKEPSKEIKEFIKKYMLMKKKGSII